MTRASRLAFGAALCVAGTLACKGSDSEGGDRETEPVSRAGSGAAGAGSGAAGTDAGAAGSMAGAAGTAEPGPPPLSATDVVGELGAERAPELCIELERIITSRITDEEVERLMCVLFGVLFSADASGTIDVAACEQQEQECLDAPGELMSSMSCDTMAAAMALESCPLTIADLRTCFETYADGLATLVGMFRCEAAASTAMATTALAGIDPSATPACMAVATQCPGLLPADASDVPGDLVGGEPAADGCDETCPFTNDGACDDGGPGSGGPFCPLGTDCMDCGPR